MQYYNARAHYLIGVHCRTLDYRRRKHLLMAHHLFRQQGALYDLELVTRALQDFCCFDLGPTLRKQLGPFNALSEQMFAIIAARKNKVNVLEKTSVPAMAAGRSQHPRAPQYVSVLSSDDFEGAGEPHTPTAAVPSAVVLACLPGAVNLDLADGGAAARPRTPLSIHNRSRTLGSLGQPAAALAKRSLSPSNVNANGTKSTNR